MDGNAGAGFTWRDTEARTKQTAQVRAIAKTEPLCYGANLFAASLALEGAKRRLEPSLPNVRLNTSLLREKSMQTAPRHP